MPRPPIDLNAAITKIRDFVRTHHRAPSMEEIRQAFSYKSKASAHFLVQQLVEKALLSKDTTGRILWDALTGVKLLGSVQAGLPSTEEEVHLDTLDLERHLVKDPQKTFLLKVSGDSMIDAGIHEGDMVLIEKDRAPENNDIVIAEVDGDWTLKYYKKDNTGVTLIPANNKYKPIRAVNQLRIGGTLVAVIRKYK